MVILRFLATLSNVIKDLAVGLTCLGLVGFGLYWLMEKPQDLPFGLATLERASVSASSNNLADKPEASMSTAFDENDVFALSRDKGGKIGKMTPRIMNYILSDRGHRISKDFGIPKDLRKRVGFWFKIYSTYTISNAVVHDVTHPWIIYEVINLNSIYNQKTKSKRRASKSRMIRSTRYKYINTLDRLSKRKHYRSLSKREKYVYNLFRGIKGKRQRVFALAKRKVRVQLGQKDSVIYAIKKSGRYLKPMERIFKKHKLPVELVRIPFLESSFNVKAYSKDGASGVWQFMYKTGKAFMKVSHARGIDERNDPYKSAEAAARLLRQNYKILKSWPLAVTAYNHGPGGLLRGIRKTGSRNLNDLIEKYKHSYFGFASKNYYAEYLAMLHVEYYQDKIFGYIKKDRELIYDDIKVKYAMRIKFITTQCHVTKKDIQLYNPDLRNKILTSRSYLPEGYYLKLPKGKAKGLIAFYKEVDETNRLLDKMLGPSPKKR